MKKIIFFAVLLTIVSISSLFTYRYVMNLNQEQIRISTNPWVGFTPFIYAQEKGWLEKTPFRFIWLVDLTENSRMYEREFTQGFTATQYELMHFKEHSHIKPVFLIDRSVGADVILSNRSLNELRNTHDPITVYLERGSLHDDILKAFIKENALEHQALILKNSSQQSMALIEPASTPIIALSYAPYVSNLTKRGLVAIASTATMKSFIIVDALYMDERFVTGREDEYRKLKTIFNRALEQLSTDPHEYYQTIHGYLEGQSYDEFMATTQQIEWLNHGSNEAIARQLETQHISTDRLLP
ncbi:hypothetical protein [Sulfuriferula thiophila]|uniref:hypothetical protein n=1 Tax=Sulfuriferula thiophila TaxID=1781211 RepID=UPI000F6093CF|nr:hypothetical protein [Sulfuriferula thiophila]